jgi:hypothetical protein
MLRPEGAVANADHTGFGTLLYTRKAGLDTTEAASVAVPSGLHAIATGEAMELDFVPLARATRYTISRAKGDNPAFAVIARNALSQACRDPNINPSRLYAYRVGAVGSARTSLPAKGMAGLPLGWLRGTLGRMPGESSASFDGELSSRAKAFQVS